MSESVINASPGTSLKNHVQRGAYKNLYENLPTTISGNILILGVLIIILRSSLSIEKITVAAGLISGTCLLRGIGYYLFKQDSSFNQLRRLKIMYNTGIFLNAAAWGFISFLFSDPTQLLNQSILIITFAGLTAGGLSSLASVSGLAISFIQVLLLPLIFNLIFLMNGVFVPVGIMLILYDLFISFATIKLNKAFIRNLRLQYRYIRASEQLSFSEQRYQTIFDEALIGILYFNRNMDIEECNQGLARIIGSSVERMKGLSLRDLPDKSILPAMEAVFQDDNGSFEGRYHTMTSDRDIWIEFRSSPIKNAEGEIIGGVAIVEDHTEKKHVQKAMEHQIYHDTMTGLSNRKMLLERLSQALKMARRHGHVGALLYLDLDKFKKVNDTMGHQTGDILLVEVASRLRRMVRDEDTVSRMGGDEFVVLLPELNSTDNEAARHATRISTRIHEALSKPIEAGGQTISTSTSIGVRIFSGEDNSTEVIKSADIAMYHAKETGRKKTCFFHANLEEQMKKQILMERELSKALKNESLNIYYQPILDIEENRVIGVEALLRWPHPELGFISPEIIIQTAENTGQIIPLGLWIIRKSLSDYRQWESSGLMMDFISINVSSNQIRKESFVKDVTGIIDSSGVPAERIVFEITESVLINEFFGIVKKIQELRNLGVKFALDDFGTGYSSLSYLRKLPVDKLKIDRSFIENLIEDNDNQALVKTILSIADHFDLSVITEGVETKEQIVLLKEMGCSCFQGYFYCKPVAERDLLKFIEDHKS